MKPLFVTGIGTGIGKTIVSAILVEKLKADYWKPIQSGDLDNSDSDKVKSLISNTVSKFHAEAYLLTQPFSPHKSADIDGIRINLDSIQIPETKNQLIIEGAGGLMVPLNEHELIIDLIEKWQAEVILVSRNYLGSINHTLLSLQELKRRNIEVKALVFNGRVDEYSESFILNYCKIEKTLRIPEISTLDKSAIFHAAQAIGL